MGSLDPSPSGDANYFKVSQLSWPLHMKLPLETSKIQAYQSFRPQIKIDLSGK